MAAGFYSPNETLESDGLKARLKRALHDRRGILADVYDLLRWLDSPADVPLIAADFLGRRNAPARLDRPVFIWGAPRSGTTLLYRLMSSHTDVGYNIHPKKQRPRESTNLWFDAFGEHRGPMDASLIRPARLRRVCREHASILEAQGKPRFLGKSPFMTLWIPLVNEVFPDARHIHVIRDGRAVLNSILYLIRHSEKLQAQKFHEDRRLFGPQPAGLVNPMAQPQAGRHVQQWCLMVEQGRKSRALLGERYAEATYEGLVTDPHGTMRAVLDHAQLPYDDAFIAATYPAEMPNRNYKFASDSSAIEADDRPYVKDMEPLLAELGYL